MLDFKRLLTNASTFRERAPHTYVPSTLASPFAPCDDQASVRDEHPHPQFRRDDYLMLNGWWECAFEQLAERLAPPAHAAHTARAAYAAHPTRPVHAERPANAAHPAPPEATSSSALAMPAEFWRTLPRPDTFDTRIRVPFSPEAPASGVCRQLQPDEVLWYRRAVTLDAGTPNDRVLLHFEAVDWACGCFVNGAYVGQHVGGYLPFTFDITSWVEQGENEIVLAVVDPSERGTQLRGKQRLESGGMWYTAQSGIWQPVWIERVPAWHMRSAQIRCDVDQGCFHLSVQTTAPGAHLHAQAFGADGQPAGPLVEGDHGGPDGIIEVDVPVERVHYWSPEDPYLYGIELSYGDDRVHSYGAFRTVGVAYGTESSDGATEASDGETTTSDAASARHLRVVLNGRPIFLKGLLDQGYWPESLMTAPSDEAMAFDIRQALDMGFNLLRKHIKVAPERWYYLCDRMGMMVLQDMPSGGGPWNASFVNSKPNLRRRTWDGVPDDTPANQAKMSADDPVYQEEWRQTCSQTIRTLGNHPSIIGWTLFNEGWGQFNAADAYARAAELDPTRPINAASGWFDQGVGDFHSVHNYFRSLELYPDRAAARHPDARTACNTTGSRAELLSEFGGFACAESDYADIEQWRATVRRELATADALGPEGLTGYVFTQIADVEGECNGLLSYDRRLNKLTGERFGAADEEGTCA